MQHDLIYYIDLQRRLQDVFLYVSCYEENFNVYSIKIEGILIETCSFFDSLCQVFIQDHIKKNYKFTKENDIKEFHEKLDAQNRRKHFHIQDYEKLLNVDFSLNDKAVILSYEYPLSLMYALYSQRTSGARGYLIQPFSDWSPKNSPFWWKAFTDLKHDRMTNFKKASLKNAIYALASVFIIITIMNEYLFCNGSVSQEIYNLFSIQYWNRSGSKMTGIPMYTRR